MLNRKKKYFMYIEGKHGNKNQVSHTICFYKYTWAPQTVHNTPVMNILKGYFCVTLFLKKRIKETNMKF